jgi:hypothetical protein
MTNKTTVIKVKLSDDTEVKVEAVTVGEQEIAFESFAFEKVLKAIEAISRDLTKTIKAVAPDKASVKFGVNICVESSGLTALLAKGSGAANLEINLEWTKHNSGV